jgi:putative AlgH/UPF0301 family transcriptional regulator
MLAAIRRMAVGKCVWLLSGAALALMMLVTLPAALRSDKTASAQSAIPPAIFRQIQSRKVDDLAPGKLLVASRDLGDPNFTQTVVLLVHYDAEGALGLVLNRRSRVPLSRVLEELKAAKDRSDPVYLGGPVEPAAVFALLQSKAKVEGAEHVFGGVYMISSKPLFEKTISAQPDPGVFHAYLGYAGWTSEQLRMEVELGAWFIFPGDAGSVFNADPDSLWSQMIRKTELKLAEGEPADPDHWPLLWSSARSSVSLVQRARSSHQVD